MYKVTIGHDARNKKKPHVVRWYGEYDPHAGKQRRYSKSFRLRSEAEQFAAEKTVKFSRGGLRDRAAEITIKDFCKDWLGVKKVEVRTSSYELYIQTTKRLMAFFGENSNIKTVNPKSAAAFISKQKSCAPGREGQELSDWSIEQIRTHCKTIFNVATQWGYIDKNPFSTLRSKKLAVKRWHKVTPQEYKELLAAAPTLQVKLAYTLFYTAGLRLHEAFNLTWADIDFEKGIITIASREGTANMPPFNVKDHEARRIPVSPHTVDFLTTFQTQAPEGVPYILLSPERYERVKVKWQQLHKERKPWRNRYTINNVLRGFKSHYKRAGIKPVGKLTIHTLRKSCGQNWSDRLPINVVKELMGHSKVETTLEFYNQLDSDHEAKAARVIQELLENKNDVKMTYKPDSAELEV